MERFDFAVIGAGPGGYVCAIRAAQLGLNVVLIEKEERLGGCCLNVGCIPSKALLESSEWFYAVRHKFSGFGVWAGKVTLDLKTMMQKKTETVRTLTDGIGMLMKKNRVTVLRGTAQLLGTGRVMVTTPEGRQREVGARTIILATGSEPSELSFMPFDHRVVVDSTEALAFEEVPGRLVVIGAGAIGLELGSVWARLGSRVTVLEMLPQIAPFADRQLATMLQRSLTGQGLEFHLNARVTGAKVKGEQVTVEYTENGRAEEVTADRCLVAVGRRPFTRGLGLEEAGVKTEAGGRVVVDEKFRTTLDGVFAIGDLIRGPMLAHKASEEGIAVAEVAAGKPGAVNYETIPNVIYTAPELAAVGRNEEELKAAGVPYRSGKFYFKGNGRALSMGETEGLVKILAHAETDRILGVHILGPHASELIAEAVVAMEFGASAEDLARICHAHPTLSEAVHEAALAVDRRQIHG